MSDSLGSWKTTGAIDICFPSRHPPIFRCMKCEVEQRYLAHYVPFLPFTAVIEENTTNYKCLLGNMK